MVISNVTLCDIEGERVCDIEVVEGEIKKIAPANSLVSDKDGSNLYFLESLVDTNVVLKDAALSGNNLDRLSLKAKKGGVGLVVLNPECTPAINNTISLEFIHNRQIKSDDTTLLESAVSAINNEGSLSNIAILLKKGARAISVSSDIDSNLLSKIAEYAKMYDVSIMCSAEDSSLQSSGVMSEGEVSSHLGLGAISPLSEITQVAKMIEIARFYGVSVLFRAISQPRSIEIITQAKTEGVDVNCEVSLFHLTHNDEACRGFNTISKIMPPLAVEDDRKKLLKALKNGEVDQLTTLHRAYSPIYKEVAFFDAEYGSEMLGDALSLYYTKLVKSGLITMSKLLELTVQKPAQLSGFERGKMYEGKKGSFLLFDREYESQIENPMSLYNNEKLFGRIVETL